MSAKFVVLAALVAIASAGGPYPPAYTPSAAPAYAKAAPEPYNDYPQYNFAYEVHADHTGDFKSQQESRDGNVVKGYYTFIEADGSRRIVEYTADDHSGFNAVVHREAGAAKPAPVYAKVATPAHPGYYH